MQLHRLLAVALAAALFTLAGPGSATAETITLQHRGLTLRGELAKAPGAELSDGVILMLHGTLAHNRMEIMQTLQTVMQDRGYTTLAVSLGLGLDNRQGMFDCATPHTHRHEDALTELGLWMNWLEGQGVERVALMGHSRGGNQVLWFDLEHDRPAVQAVIAIAPATWDAAATAADYEARYGVALAEVYARAEALHEQGKGEASLEGVGFVYCEDATVTADAFLSYYRDDWRKDSPQVIAKLGKPVLVFAGSEDEVVKGLIPRLEGVADGQWVRLEVIDGADHFFRDLYAEDIGDLVDEYLAW
jgi:pimeloyl-ACP methyl ester carboxylesterase